MKYEKWEKILDNMGDLNTNMEILAGYIKLNNNESKTLQNIDNFFENLQKKTNELESKILDYEKILIED